MQMTRKMHFTGTLLATVFLSLHALGQTVYMAGDSTMARNGGGSGTDGECNNTVKFRVQNSAWIVRLGPVLGTIFDNPCR